jgi:hypothetical protein
MLRGNPALAVAEPAADHPAIRGVSRVVTNHATGLEHPGLSALLVVRGDGEDDVLLAVAGTVGHGRLLALGDASVFINSMLRYPGNRDLATALVRYAVEDGGKEGARGAGKLYVLANDFETTGSFGEGSPLEQAATEARRSLVEALETLRRDGMPPLFAYLAAVCVGAGVVAWTGARAGKTHRVATPRFLRPVPVVAHGGIAGHAAVLGAPGTSRALAVVELKSALEEELATGLGLQRAPPSDQLVARLRAARRVDDEGAEVLYRLFADMSRVEARLARQPAPSPLRRLGARPPSDAEVLRLAAQVQAVRRRLGLAAEDGPS